MSEVRTTPKQKSRNPERDVVDHPPSAAEVIQQMHAIRQNLRPEVDEIVSSARNHLDWHYYLKAYPWQTLACATALGYLAVPRKLVLVQPDAETVEKLARQNRLVVEHRPKGEEKPGLVDTILHLAGHMIMRAGMAYLGQQAGRLAGRQAAESAPEPAGVE